MKKETLTTGDIAKYCQVNFRTVIRWIERGLLKAYKLPGRGDNRVQVNDFIRFLSDNDMPIPEELRLSTPRVLIVEDDPTMAQIIDKVLQNMGFETRIAPSGFHAGVELSEFSPSMMTLDLDIPGLSGLEVLRYVRKTPALKSIKVLVVSGRPDEELKASLTAGADDILAKPIRPGELQQKIHELKERA